MTKSKKVCSQFDVVDAHLGGARLGKVGHFSVASALTPRYLMNANCQTIRKVGAISSENIPHMWQLFVVNVSSTTREYSIAKHHECNHVVNDRVGKLIKSAKLRRGLD